MSTLRATNVHQSQTKQTDRKAGNGPVVLICVALGLAAATAAFATGPAGIGTSNDAVYVGP